jgi:hypothetical protein
VVDWALQRNEYIREVSGYIRQPTRPRLREDAKELTEADIALLDSVLAFLVNNNDVAIEFCTYLLRNMGNKGAERAQAIFGLKSIVFCAICDAEPPGAVPMLDIARAQAAASQRAEMSKETVAAIISEHTMVDDDGLVQNAEEVAQTIIDAIGAASVDAGAEIEATPGHVTLMNGTAPAAVLTDADVRRQSATLINITKRVFWRVRRTRQYQPSFSDILFIVETMLQVPDDELLDAKRHLERELQMRSQKTT